MSTLLPCPFCNSRRIFMDTGAMSVFAMCETCRATGPIAWKVSQAGPEEIAEVTRIWNHRPGEAAAVHRVLVETPNRTERAFDGDDADVESGLPPWSSSVYGS